MAFNMKTWVDRITEYPTRRRLRKEDGSDELVTVSREEGQVSEEGDAFSAENMNDLERRIDSAFKDVNNSLVDINSNLTKIAPNDNTVTVRVPVNLVKFGQEYVGFVEIPNHLYLLGYRCTSVYLIVVFVGQETISVSDDGNIFTIKSQYINQYTVGTYAEGSLKLAKQ